MLKKPGSDQEDISIEAIYPDFTPADIAETEATFERYLALVLRVYKRIQFDPESYTQFRALTGE